MGYVMGWVERSYIVGVGSGVCGVMLYVCMFMWVVFSHSPHPCTLFSSLRLLSLSFHLHSPSIHPSINPHFVYSLTPFPCTYFLPLLLPAILPSLNSSTFFFLHPYTPPSTVQLPLHRTSTFPSHPLINSSFHPSTPSQSHHELPRPPLLPFYHPNPFLPPRTRPSSAPSAANLCVSRTSFPSNSLWRWMRRARGAASGHH